jgi:hypothetical protein
MKLKTLFFAAFLYSTSINAQTIPNTAFQSGEVLRFKGSFYMSSLWADLAELKIEVSDHTAEGKSLYSIKATASSYANYDSYFKIRDLYQSWVDKKDLKPYIFKRNVDEGGYAFNMKYIFKRSAKQCKYEYERNGAKKNSVIAIKDDTHDLVSILYYVRTLDYDKMTTGKTMTISLVVDDKLNYVTITYRGKENVKTDVFGSKQCHKLGVAINNQSLKNNAANNIWLTADKNRVPVQIKAEIPVGSVQVRLVEAKGLTK